MKKYVVVLFCLFFSSTMFTAKAQFQVDLSADIQSRYVWRGQPLGGTAPAIEPGVFLKSHGLEFGAWGAYSLSANSYQELDWILSYSFWKERVTLMVTDYGFPQFLDLYRYFDYRKDSTSHVLEGGLQFKVPKTGLTLSVYTNFYGADARKTNGHLVYSTYCEAMYELEAKKIKTSFDFTCGMAVNGKDGGFYGNNGFGVVNVSLGVTKNIEIDSTFTLPIYARVIANPVANKMYFVAGATINL